jgi:hypothetical protein
MQQSGQAGGRSFSLSSALSGERCHGFINRSKEHLDRAALFA